MGGSRSGCRGQGRRDVKNKAGWALKYLRSWSLGVVLPTHPPLREPWPGLLAQPPSTDGKRSPSYPPPARPGRSCKPLSPTDWEAITCLGQVFPCRAFKPPNSVLCPHLHTLPGTRQGLPRVVPGDEQEQTLQHGCWLPYSHDAKQR